MDKSTTRKSAKKIPVNKPIFLWWATRLLSHLLIITHLAVTLQKQPSSCLPFICSENGSRKSWPTFSYSERILISWLQLQKLSRQWLSCAFLLYIMFMMKCMSCFKTAGGLISEHAKFTSRRHTTKTWTWVDVPYIYLGLICEYVAEGPSGFSQH